MAVDDDQIEQIKDQIKELSRDHVINLITKQDENDYISTLNRGLNNSSYTFNDDGPNALSSDQLKQLRETAFEHLLKTSEPMIKNHFQGDNANNFLKELLKIVDADEANKIRKGLYGTEENDLGLRSALSLVNDILLSNNAVSDDMTKVCQDHLIIHCRNYLEELIDKTKITSQEVGSAIIEIISGNNAREIKERLDKHQQYLGQPGEGVYNDSKIVNKDLRQKLYTILMKKLICESISAMSDEDTDSLKNVLTCKKNKEIRQLLQKNKNKFVKYGDVADGILISSVRVPDDICLPIRQKALTQLLALSFNRLTYTDINILEAISETQDIESLKNTFTHYCQKLQLSEITVPMLPINDAVFAEIKRIANHKVTQLKEARLQDFKNNREAEAAKQQPAGQEREKLKTLLFSGGMTIQEMREIAVTVTRKITEDETATLPDTDVTEDLSAADKPTHKMELKKIAGGGVLTRKQEGPHQATYALKNSTAESLYHKFLIIALAVKKECEIKGISIENEKIILSNIIPKDSFEAQQACEAAFRKAEFKNVKYQQEPVSLNVQTLSGPSF